MTKVYLESSEGKKILVKRDLLQNLGTLKKLVQSNLSLVNRHCIYSKWLQDILLNLNCIYITDSTDLGCEEDEVIPLPAVPAKILKKV